MKRAIELCVAIALGSWLGRTYPYPSPIVFAPIIILIWVAWSHVRPFYGLTSFEPRQHVAGAAALVALVGSGWLFTTAFGIDFRFANIAAIPIGLFVFYIVATRSRVTRKPPADPAGA